jgi:hypothetical protein
MRLKAALFWSVIPSFGTAVNETDAQYQGWTFVYDANSPAALPAQANPYSTQCAYPAQTNNKPVPCNALSANPEQPNQCGQGGGLWMFARGPAANTNGEVFTVAGNGGFNYCQGAACTIQCMPSGQPITLAYWKPAPGGFLVAWPWHETLSSYQWTNPGGGYNFNLAATTSSPLPGAALGGYGGGTLAITANPSDSSGDAIVRASVFPQSCTTIPHDPYSGAGRGCPGYLLAYKLDSATGALTWI